MKRWNLAAFTVRFVAVLRSTIHVCHWAFNWTLSFVLAVKIVLFNVGGMLKADVFIATAMAAMSSLTLDLSGVQLSAN
jgi:hypothetical protein